MSISSTTAASRLPDEGYRDVFDRCPQPMWIYERATLRFLAVNQAAVERYGYSRDEFLSMTIRDIRPEEDILSFDRHIAENPEPAQHAGTWRHRTRDGRVIFVEVLQTTVQFEGRSSSLVLLNDVTLKRDTEEKARLQATALEAAANAIVITDADGAIEWVNPAFERLTGYSRSEVLGQNPRLLKSGSQDPAFYSDMWRTISAGHVWEGEIVNRRKDGCLYTEYQTITPVRDAHGAITNFVGIKEDITERRHAEEVLQRSEAEARSIIEGAPYGIYRVRRDGHILMANPALADLLGYESPDELVGLNSGTSMYLAPEEREQYVKRWYSKEGITPYEAIWKRKDGKRITVRLAGRVLPHVVEEPESFEVFVEDITSQKVLQQQLQQAQKMEAIGRLAGGVAHDFNNLLMIMGSCAQLLHESLHDPAKAGKYAGQIRDAVDKAATLTRQLLAFSRQQVLEPTVLSLNSVVEDLCKMLPRLLGEDVTVVRGLAPDLHNVHVDRGQIEQVLMNLAVNARDAMPKGGKLVIETANADLDTGYSVAHGNLVPPGRYAMLAVTDTGMGMTPDIKAKIFEPFFTTKPVGQGTGLGLATVYGIVKQSGGYIWVYSEPGQGTTFKVYFPISDAAATPTMRAMQPAPSGIETVLLVEDEAVLRQVTAEFLRDKGYTVLEAPDPEGALEIWKSRAQEVAIVITDVVMPGGTGPELAEALLKSRPDLPVLYISGYTDRTIDNAHLGPRAAFLQKPVNLVTLATRVRSLLDGPGKAQEPAR